MKSDELQDHIFATYITLRIGVAVIAIAFPLLLWAGGAMQGLPLQDSMSAYYHVASNDIYNDIDGNLAALSTRLEAEGMAVLLAGMQAPMRIWFVGILFAVGMFLYLYKGYSHQENAALNIAGACALGIAIFPMEWTCGKGCENITLHGITAISFFLSIAYVCIRCASDTLHLLNDEVRERRYRILYMLIGVGMILSPLIALLLTLVFQQLKSFVFFVEAAGIWIFAAYWLLKSRELSSTNAEHLALHEKIET